MALRIPAPCILCTLLLAVSLPSPATARPEEKATLDQVDTCREAFARRDPEELALCYDVGASVQLAGHAEVVGGPQVVAKLAQPLWDAFPNLRVQPVWRAANGNIAAEVWYLTGTFRKKLGARKPTHKTFGVYLFRHIRLAPNRRIAEEHVIVDLPTAARQLGLSGRAARGPAVRVPATRPARLHDPTPDAGRGLGVLSAAQGAFNDGDWKGALRDFDPDVQVVLAPGAREIAGRDALLAALGAAVEPYSKLQYTPQAGWVAGALLVTLGRVTGTPRGEGAGAKRTLDFAEVYRIKPEGFTSAKVVEWWAFWNSEQLGAEAPKGAR